MAKRSLQGFPAGKWLTVTGHSRVKAVKVNRNGTVDAKVLDKPARNTKPKKKRKAKAKTKRPRKATNKKRTTKAVRRVPKKRKGKRAVRKATNKKRPAGSVRYARKLFKNLRAASLFQAEHGGTIRTVGSRYEVVYPTMKKNKKRAPKKKRPLKMGSKAWVKKMARARARAARRRAA